MKKVIFIFGPTGVGKSMIGYKLALKTGGEIISADSRQIYKYMDIGTDKPPTEYLDKVPHHFIGSIDPGVNFNAGTFGKEARNTIDEILDKNKLPVVVGGSGLYIRSILEGFFNANAKDNEIRKSLNAKMEEQGLGQLYKELKIINEEYAASVSENDKHRILRALEVYYVTGKPITLLWKESEKIKLNFEPLLVRLILDIKILYEKINNRVDQMIDKGLVEEVKKLIEAGFNENKNSFRTFGYKEVSRYLNEEIDFKEMVESIKKGTRNFAKRQITWFKKMENVNLIDASHEDDEIIMEIMALYNE